VNKRNFDFEFEVCVHDVLDVVDWHISNSIQYPCTCFDLAFVKPSIYDNHLYSIFTNCYGIFQNAVPYG